jgi:hypothetical protein
MKQIITILIVILTGIVNGQEKVLFHSYIPTASSWDILEWNVSDTSDTKWHLKETLDNQGRVIELEFLKDGKLVDDPLCYLANRITFEYNQNQIIETLYHFNQEIYTTDCEMYYKTIYHLDKKGFITKRESFAKYDFDGLEKSEIEKLKKFVPEHAVMTDSIGTNLEVEYYYHSFAKMNGIYPVNKNYEFKDDYYYGDQPEKESVIKGIKRNN